jgi:hypothetical protein
MRASARVSATATAISESVVTSRREARDDAAKTFRRVSQNFKIFLDTWCRCVYLRLPLRSVCVLWIGFAAFAFREPARRFLGL